MKKKHLISCLCAVLLLALVAGAFWYTRPQSWDSIVTGEHLTSLSAVAIEMGTSDGHTYMKSWELAFTQGGDGPAQDGDVPPDLVSELLEGGSYRASLLNLLPGHSYLEQGVDGTVLISMVLDGQPLSVHFTSSDTLLFSDGGGTLAYHSGGGLYDSLFAVIQEHGALQEHEF